MMPEVVPRFTPQRLLPPDKWRERQLENLKKVGKTNYETRLPLAKRDPITAAIAAKEKWWNQLEVAHEEDRFGLALQDTSAQEWLTYGIKIGADRLVGGVTMREPEVKSFIDRWTPLLMDHLAKIDPMKTVTLDDRIEKMEKNARGLAALHGQWRTRGS